MPCRGQGPQQSERRYCADGELVQVRSVEQEELNEIKVVPHVEPRFGEK